MPGATREFLGELRKLGITVARSTIVNILREAGLDPNPQRGRATWSDFVKRHAQTLWACDFLQKRIWTLCGPVHYFLLFFMHVGSRRVHLAGITSEPTVNWVAQKARDVAQVFKQEPIKPAYLLRDRDSKYSIAFDDAFKEQGVEVVKVGPRAPNMNAYIERFLGTLQAECLDHFVILGADHLRYLVESFLNHYYHEERPHQGLDNLPLTGRVAKPPPDWTPDDVVCHERLGGLLKSYSWKLAA
jgi:putative transposase